MGVTFAGGSRSLIETRRQPYQAQFNFHRHPRQAPALYQVSISGPFESGERQSTPSRERIFTRMPASTEEEDGVAREILGNLIRRAYRRPVEESDLERPLQFFREARDTGGFEAGIEMALSSILVSPRFLVRVENDPAETEPGTVYPLDDIALASRLSFFLWSSIPDDELLDLAERGELSEARRSGKSNPPDVGGSEIRFARHQLRRPVAPPPQPRFGQPATSACSPTSTTTSAGRSAARPSSSLNRSLREDRSVLDLLKTDYTFLNDRLAKHYGIPDIDGSHFRRVALGRGQRPRRASAPGQHPHRHLLREPHLAR